MKYTVHVISKDGRHYQTSFEGYAAESCADRYFREQRDDNPRTYAVALFQGEDVRAQFGMKGGE